MEAVTRDAAVEAFEAEVRACRACAQDFAATATAHAPRPVTWIGPDAPLLICSQAPGARVQASGIFFDDRSGDRLREWLGVRKDVFYDRSRIAILPMAACFPGYDAKGSDLPPPRRCAELWRDRALALMPRAELTLVIGGYAQAWHLGGRMGVTERVRRWREVWPEALPLPHPSWRNTAWLKRNPWFEAEVLPVLRARVAELTG
ncbi:MAG: uracil-DNA glycosylase family protein [Pseudomonadota bacterium]